MSHGTDGAARAVPNLLEQCRVVTEEDDSQSTESTEIFKHMQKYLSHTDDTDDTDLTDLVWFPDFKK